jgi:hypothetical protein
MVALLLALTQVVGRERGLGRVEGGEVIKY